MIRKKWISDNSKLNIIKALSEELDIDETIIRILVLRGIDTADKIKEFLNPLMEGLYDPYLLKDMDKGVERIKRAILNNEMICIYGDYDADGITSSSIIYKFLSKKTKNIFIYIPNREEEGYGVNKEAVKKIKNRNTSLIITVDCGITSKDEVELAKKLGIDMVITDHHNCPDILPDAYAVINPKRKDQEYPFSELCGAGVSYKLVCAFNEPVSDEILGIAAVGTVADIVPLVSENRVIVYYGLEIIKRGELEGIKVLVDYLGIKTEDVSSETLGYKIAPRINAAGRMTDAKEAFGLFLKNNSQAILKTVETLDMRNTERRKKEEEIIEFAEYVAKKENNFANCSVIVLYKEGLHEGVIGIVASRICEKYYKPCIILSLKDGILKGSGRSIKGFDIHKALFEISDIIEKFGGHELAAGLTLKREKLDEFIKRINEIGERIFKEKKPVPSVEIDAEFKGYNINDAFVEKLKILEPFGMGNRTPVFVLKDAKIKEIIPLSDSRHLKLKLEKGDKVIEAIGFNMGKYAGSLKLNEFIHVVGTLGFNKFRGVRTIQMKIEDIRLG